MKRSIHIEAPVESVFEFFFESLKSPAKIADLTPGHAVYDEVKATKDGVGTYYDWHATIYGLPMRGFDVVTDVVPNKHITERSSNSVVGTWDYGFEPEGSGTKLTMEHQAESFWRLPPLSGLIDLAMQRANETFMARLKQTIESQGA